MPPEGSGPVENALARSRLEASPAAIKATVGSAPTLLMNGFQAGAGEPSIPGIAIGINVIVEWFKNRSWFREQVWTIPLLVFLSFAIGFGIWFLIVGSLKDAVENGFNLLGTAHVNYQSMKAAGIPILGPTREENRWHSKQWEDS